MGVLQTGRFPKSAGQFSPRPERPKISHPPIHAQRFAFFFFSEYFSVRPQLPIFMSYYDIKNTSLIRDIRSNGSVAGGEPWLGSPQPPTTVRLYKYYYTHGALQGAQMKDRLPTVGTPGSAGPCGQAFSFPTPVWAPRRAAPAPPPAPPPSLAPPSTSARVYPSAPPFPPRSSERAWRGCPGRPTTTPRRRSPPGPDGDRFFWDSRTHLRDRTVHSWRARRRGTTQPNASSSSREAPRKGTATGDNNARLRAGREQTTVTSTGTDVAEKAAESQKPSFRDAWWVAHTHGAFNVSPNLRATAGATGAQGAFAIKSCMIGEDPR